MSEGINWNSLQKIEFPSLCQTCRFNWLNQDKEEAKSCYGQTSDDRESDLLSVMEGKNTVHVGALVVNQAVIVCSDYEGPDRPGVREAFLKIMELYRKMQPNA